MQKQRLPDSFIKSSIKNIWSHRQVNSAVYHVFDGKGYSVVDGQRFEWEEGDFFLVPPWAWNEHANECRQKTILFSVQDSTVMRALGLYRQEPCRENGGHQKITDAHKV